MKENSVYGVGINDADYVVQDHKTGWLCPFYSTWHNMLLRCYSSVYHNRQPTYINCYVEPTWLRFRVFKMWMESKPWENNELDKDILFQGNKVYGPTFCVFVSKQVNTFLSERGANRGDYPIGVGLHKPSGLFRARCGDTKGGRRNLGYFRTPEKAHEAWLTFKLGQAKLLALQQTDIRVAEALVKRYEDYKWITQS